MQLSKISNDKKIVTTKNKVKNIGILAKTKEKRIGQKRGISFEIIVTIIIRGLQQFDKYNKSNAIEIKIDGNKIIVDLAKYRKFNYRFLIDNFILSSAISNDSSVIFITANGLNETKNALMIGN